MHLRIILVIIGITLIGFMKSCNDIDYAISGVETTGTVTGYWGVEGEIPDYVVFEFTDEEGKLLKTKCKVPEDLIREVGDNPQIVYMPGRFELDGKTPVARLKILGSVTGLFMFVGGLTIALIYGFIWFKYLEGKGAD